MSSGVNRASSALGYGRRSSTRFAAGREATGSEEGRPRPSATRSSLDAARPSQFEPLLDVRISRGPAHERPPVFEISLPISRPEVFCSQKRRWGFPVTYACTTSREK